MIISSRILSFFYFIETLAKNIETCLQNYVYSDEIKWLRNNAIFQSVVFIYN